jgi:hypothetical protein
LEGDLAGRAQRAKSGGIVAAGTRLGVATGAPEVVGGQTGPFTGSQTTTDAVTLRTGEVGLLEHGLIEAFLSDRAPETVLFGQGEAMEVVREMPICGRVLQ